MKPTLSKRAVSRIISIAESTTKAYRTELNKNVHVADIGYSTIASSVKELSNEEYNIIIETFKKESDVSSTSLAYSVSQIKKEKWTGLVLVEDPKFGQFLVATSYNALQKHSSKVLKSLSGKYENLESLLGTDEKNRTQARIGHIASSFSHTRTPLLDKLNDVYKRLPQTAGNKVLNYISQVQLEHIAEVEYAFDRPNPIGKQLSTILGRGTVLVTLQSDAKNSALAKVEARINRDVIRYLKSAEFISDILIEPGSNSILQDIAHSLRMALDPKLKSAPKHGKKAPTKGTSKAKGASKVLPFKSPQLRNLKGQFYSLTSLENLLNANLTEKIKQNMGNGSRKDILNLRTGRFAESVKVERLSESRAGMITAFYNYMKYPYQTFEPGYRQGSPASRNPKLLISRSIREIAAQQVGNRLRSVSL